jgi:hypothetical protein
MSNSQQQIRYELARRSQWNIGYFASGFLFWIFVGIIGQLFPLNIARFYWVFGSGLIVPTAIGISRLLGADPFSKGNTLGELVGNSHLSSVVITFPILVVAFFHLPEALPLIMAITYCIDFYVMSWAFGSRLFILHATIRTVAVTIIWFMLPAWRMILIPLVVALFYLITVLLIPPMRRKWMAQNSAYASQSNVA